MNLICYEYYTEKLINIVLLNIPANIHCPYRLFLKDGLFCPGPTLTIDVITLAKVWHRRKGGFVPGGLHNASHLRAMPSGACACFARVRMRMLPVHPHLNGLVAGSFQVAHGNCSPNHRLFSSRSIEFLKFILAAP